MNICSYVNIIAYCEIAKGRTIFNQEWNTTVNVYFTMMGQIVDSHELK